MFNPSIKLGRLKLLEIIADNQKTVRINEEN